MRNEFQIPPRPLIQQQQQQQQPALPAPSPAARSAATNPSDPCEPPVRSIRTARPLPARIRAESPERLVSFSAPTSPFLPRFGRRPPSLAEEALPQRARTLHASNEAEFGSHEASLPLLAAPLSQQISPVHARARSVHSERTPFSEAYSPRELALRRSSIAVAGSAQRLGSTEGRILSSSSSSSSDEEADDAQSGSFDGDVDTDPMALDDGHEAGPVVRNKAVERLMSLVEEDRAPLASEMEHEGHITRSIRHSSVQEWLRASPAFSSSTRDPDAACPASPSSSALSSPRLPAATSCPASARCGKRKSVDEPSEHPPRSNAFKRLAMSPSGLRAHAPLAKPSARRIHAHPSPRSNPGSPLLLARPTLPASSAGVCPPLGAPRSRSRSGASLLGAPNVMQTNGVFSRMNISDGNERAPD
ncbi:hypothetical protein LPJ68_000228 [Coemansia sp. RSA 1086]|nr:hypothetical protein LPJ68_000228 [Coemansia sp. RSA 1086]